MRILMSGSHGLIGSALHRKLRAGGHEVVRLTRRVADSSESAVVWDPSTGTLDPGKASGFDGVVHLAGEPVSGRWTAARKAAIRASRTKGTSALAGALAQAERPPGVLVCASAAHFYGDRGDEELTEDSPAGVGFLPEVVREWEAAAEPARAAGIRTVHLRQPMVLSPAGGALQRLLLPFRLGLGGRMGSGRQWWTWIGLDELTEVYEAALTRDDLSGPVIAATPQPVRNRDFARILGRVLGRPAIFPLPATVLQLLLGEMADEMLLSSTRLVPSRLSAAGFAFRHPDLESALRHLLGRERA